MATGRGQFGRHKKNITHELVVLPNCTRPEDGDNNYAQLKTIRSPESIYESSTPQLNDTDAKLSISELDHDQQYAEIQKKSSGTLSKET